MPLLTDYWFKNRFWYGSFEQSNSPFANGGSASISDTGSSAATLTLVRQDNEKTLDFANLVGSPIITSNVDVILQGTGAKRTSGVTAQGIFWKDVPHGTVGRHHPWDMLVRVYFNVHISTPWYCPDVDATLSYYLLFWLDGAGLLHGQADYATWTFSGGGACVGGVNDAIRAALQKGFKTVQKIIDKAIPLEAPGKYSMLYFLPGNGTRTAGSSTQNADQDVNLALLPKEGR